MKTWTIIISMIAAVSAASLSAQQQESKDEKKDQQSEVEREKAGAAAIAETATIKATVEDINREKREVTLKGEDGKTKVLEVPESARNFDQLQKGDEVTAKYFEGIAVGVRKSDEAPAQKETKKVYLPEKGEKPGMMAVKTKEVSADIENIDTEKREITIKGPEGRSVTLKADKDVDLDRIKQGDKVFVTHTEAMAIDVSPASK